MTLTRVTALSGDTILPLADAKAQVRVLHSNEDSLIASMRDAAIDHVERVSGVALASGSWRWTLRSFLARIDLPMRPATAVTAVAYHDADGVEQPYAGARLIDGSVYPAVNGSWPSAYNYVAVTFTAGLASASEAPDLLAAVKLMVGHLYANREAVNVGNIVSELPFGVQALIGIHRKVLV